MKEQFLQEFLKTGLFDIGDSDDRLQWLQESIVDLQKKFKGDYSLLPAHTLVALDPNISDQEPVMIETEKIITDHWKALRGKYSEMPRNIIRGVILNALNIVGMGDPLAARIIYLTALNFLPYAKLNNENKIVEAMLNRLGELAEKDAVEKWALVEKEPSLKIGTLKINDFKFGEAKINSAKLQEGLKTAVLNSPQGHGSNNGGNSTWGDHFSKNASDAIAGAFNNALTDFNQSLSPTLLETQVNNFISEVKKTISASLKTVLSGLTAVERRSKLLWWKESLYSPSLKRSYRGIEDNLLPIVMAVDLNNQLPKKTPISVDFLLKDTLFIVNEKKEKVIKFETVLDEISSGKYEATLNQYFTNSRESNGRISITDFISLLINNKAKVEDFQIRTGIEETEEITLSELSITILHDLLIQRLIVE